MTSPATHNAMPAKHTRIGGHHLQVSGSVPLATECAETQAGRAFPKTEEGFRRAEEGFRRAETRYFRPPLHHSGAEVGSREADSRGRSAEQDCRWPQGRSPSAGVSYPSSKMHSPEADVPYNLRFNIQKQKS